MSKTFLSVIVAVAAAALIALLGAQFLMTRSDDPFASCRTSSVSGGGTLGGSFTLVDEDGKTVTDQDVIDRPSLLYFGYTFCPDVCPTDSARNAEVADILQERGYDFRPVLVTIDPERDTPDVLKEFTDYLHPDMIGLTGTPEQIKAVAQLYRAYYKRQPSEDQDYYLVDHSTFSYLVLPEHGFVEFVRREEEPEAVANKLACFIDKAN